MYSDSELQAMSIRERNDALDEWESENARADEQHEWLQRNKWSM